jgi:hypothetical protein
MVCASGYAMPADFWDVFSAYQMAGFFLIPIKPRDGKPQKGPCHEGWTQPASHRNPLGYSSSPMEWDEWYRHGWNIGLALLPSRVVSFDIDDMRETRRIFDGLGLPLGTWLSDPQAVRIESGRPNKGKLLFRVPEGFDNVTRKLIFGSKTAGNQRTIFELRFRAASSGATHQDVMPPSIHPNTGKPYRLAGDVRLMPELPGELLDVWRNWDAWKRCFDSFDPNYQEPLPAQPKRTRETLTGERDAIAEFNQCHTVNMVLERNGYQCCGKRYIRPGSNSGSPGVVIFDSGRCFSHGGDALNDGYSHDAFDVFRILECGGEWVKALAWNPELTAHNQRLWSEYRRQNHTHDGGTNPEVVSPRNLLINLFEWRAADRFCGEPPARRWLVRNVFPLGKPCLIAAAGGVGKSFLLLALAHAVAALKSNFDPQADEGGMPSEFGALCAGGAAVFITAEDDAVEVHQRLKSLNEIPPELYVVPLPDAGGSLPLFRMEAGTRAPITTPAFYALKEQFTQIGNLRLIVFDPLQTFCLLDLNDPTAAQHVCAELSALATETGATVIVSHHFRKGGEIDSPETARDAIRGTGGLVDGVRAVYALWTAEEKDGQQKCRALGVPWQRGRVVYGGLVKANGAADLSLNVFVRDECGLLRDRRLELGLLAPKRNDLLDILRRAIARAAEKMQPFTKTGSSGLYNRRHELPAQFHDTGKHKLEEMAQELLNKGMLVQCRMKPSEKQPGCWLDIPDGPLASASTNITEAELAKLNGADAINPKKKEQVAA